MGFTTGILLFDDAEELDFAGPWEVLTSAAMLEPEDRVVTIAERSPVRCAKGLRVLADHTLADAPPLDVVLVPGGQGTRREHALDPVERAAHHRERRSGKAVRGEALARELEQLGAVRRAGLPRRGRRGAAARGTRPRPWSGSG